MEGIFLSQRSGLSYLESNVVCCSAMTVRTACAITSPVKQADGPLLPLRFRMTITLSKDAVQRARLYITSLGVFQAYINGVAVGDHRMAPGWTSYNHRLNCEAFDVASLLHEGENAIAVKVAEVPYATQLGFMAGQRFIYGDEIALIAQLEIGSDADKITLVYGSSWKCHISALISIELYDGGIHDARKEQERWNDKSFR